MPQQTSTPAPRRQEDGGARKLPEQPEPAPKPNAESEIKAERARWDANRAAPAAAVQTIGPDAPRYDAREKVTGRARYASDAQTAAPLYAYAIHSPVARGRIRRFDSAEAARLPGVVRIFGPDAFKDRIKPLKFFGAGGAASTDLSYMTGPEIAHEGQIIGMVAAETYEAARDAARRVKIDIDAAKPAASFGDEGVRTRAVKDVNPRWKDPATGDFDAAFAAAPVKVDAEYVTPVQHHNPIELFTTTCVWDDDQLTVHEPSGGVHLLKNGLATQLGVEPGKVRVFSPYVGGSFGAKVGVTPRTVLVALMAKDLRRPVKLVLTREQGFTNATHRAETRHRIRLAANRDGKLQAYGHEGWEVTSRTDAYSVNGTENSVHMYAWPNVKTAVNIVEADRNTPGFMRSPPEVPYIYALEVAMDEMAEALAMDPVAFRKLNDAQVSSIEDKPYTSRNLNACLDRAATAFGWSRRNPEPGSMREGDWLIGYGCAMATYPSNILATAVRLQVNPDASAIVEVAAHDIGTGAYTVAQMTAAQELGIDIAKVTVKLGDSDLPPGPLAGGSNTTASICNAIASVSHNLRERLGVAKGASIATGLKGGVVEERLDYFPAGGTPAAQGTPLLYRGVPLFTGGMGGDKLRSAFGAEFVEVRINARTREIRVPRIVGAFAAGRIMNERTARSQLLGGMIWGVSSALHEATEIDHRTAKYVNDNIAEYLIPVNADVPSVEIIMIPEEDRDVNPLGIKGVGELGNVGTAAAVANAVYHATGKRIRDLPIRIEHLI